MYWRKARVKKDPRSMFKLAALYNRYNESKKAHIWYDKAAKKGLREAKVRFNNTFLRATRKAT